MNLEINPNHPAEDEYFLSKRLFFVCCVDAGVVLTVQTVA